MILGVFLQSSSNYSVLPFEVPPDGVNSNGHFNISVEMGVSKYNTLITCSFKSYFHFCRVFRKVYLWQARSLCILMKNQPNHLKNLKIALEKNNKLQ